MKVFDNYNFDISLFLKWIFLKYIQYISQILGKKFKILLIISSITSGGNKSEKLNRSLGRLSNDYGVGFMVGSDI